MSGENMTRMRMRIRAAAGLAVAAIMTLAGCGGSSASAKPADSRTADNNISHITIGGEQALVLAGSDGSTLDVAAHGNAYPLRAIAPKSAKAGEITFSQWNAVPVITAPPAGQVVNLSQLTG